MFMVLSFQEGLVVVSQSKRSRANQESRELGEFTYHEVAASVSPKSDNQFIGISYIIHTSELNYKN